MQMGGVMMYAYICRAIYWVEPVDKQRIAESL